MKKIKKMKMIKKKKHNIKKNNNNIKYTFKIYSMVFIEVVYRCTSLNGELNQCYNNIHDIKNWCKKETDSVSEIYKITRQGWIFVGDKEDNKPINDLINEGKVFYTTEELHSYYQYVKLSNLPREYELDSIDDSGDINEQTRKRIIDEQMRKRIVETEKYYANNASPDVRHIFKNSFETLKDLNVVTVTDEDVKDIDAIYQSNNNGNFNTTPIATTSNVPSNLKTDLENLSNVARQLQGLFVNIQHLRDEIKERKGIETKLQQVSDLINSTNQNNNAQLQIINIINEYEGTILELEAELVTMKSNIQTAQSENEKTDASNKDRIQALRKRVQKIEEEKILLKEKNDSLQSQYELLQQEQTNIKGLCDQIEGMKSSNDDFLERINDQMITIQTLNFRNKYLNNQLSMADRFGTIILKQHIQLHLSMFFKLLDGNTENIDIEAIKEELQKASQKKIEELEESTEKERKRLDDMVAKIQNDIEKQRVENEKEMKLANEYYTKIETNHANTIDEVKTKLKEERSKQMAELEELKKGLESKRNDEQSDFSTNLDKLIKRIQSEITGLYDALDKEIEAQRKRIEDSFGEPRRLVNICNNYKKVIDEFQTSYIQANNVGDVDDIDETNNRTIGDIEQNIITILIKENDGMMFFLSSIDIELVSANTLENVEDEILYVFLPVFSKYFKWKKPKLLNLFNSLEEFNIKEIPSSDKTKCEKYKTAVDVLKEFINNNEFEDSMFFIKFMVVFKEFIKKVEGKNKLNKNELWSGFKSAVYNRILNNLKAAKNLYEEFITEHQHPDNLKAVCANVLNEQNKKFILSYVRFNDKNINDKKKEHTTNPRYQFNKIKGNTQHLTLTHYPQRVDLSEHKNYKNEFESHTYNYGNFTKIFPQTETNDDITDKIKKDIIDPLLDNKIVFIIGYGASGSGKTSALVYLRLGENSQNGIFINICNEVASKLPKNKGEIKLEIKVKEMGYANERNGYRKKSIKVNERDTVNYYEFTEKTIKAKYEENTHTQKTEFTLKEYFKGTSAASHDNYVHTYRDEQLEGDHKIKFDNLTLGVALTDAVDIDRVVKPTPNNPNSSRSHCLVLSKITQGEDNYFIILGDFAGVENEFDSNNIATIKQFANLRGHLSNKFEYLTASSSPDIAIDRYYGGNKTPQQEIYAWEADKADTLKREERYPNVFNNEDLISHLRKHKIFGDFFNGKTKSIVGKKITNYINTLDSTDYLDEVFEPKVGRKALWKSKSNGNGEIVRITDVLKDGYKVKTDTGEEEYVVTLHNPPSINVYLNDCFTRPPKESVFTLNNIMPKQMTNNKWRSWYDNRKVEGMFKLTVYVHKPKNNTSNISFTNIQQHVDLFENRSTISLLNPYFVIDRKYNTHAKSGSNGYGKEFTLNSRGYGVNTDYDEFGYKMSYDNKGNAYWTNVDPLKQYIKAKNETLGLINLNNSINKSERFVNKDLELDLKKGYTIDSEELFMCYLHDKFVIKEVNKEKPRNISLHEVPDIIKSIKYFIDKPGVLLDVGSLNERHESVQAKYIPYTESDDDGPLMLLKYVTGDNEKALEQYERDLEKKDSLIRYITGIIDKTKKSIQNAKAICQNRYLDGRFINTSLSLLRDDINLVMYHKRNAVSNYAPNIILDCFQDYNKIHNKISEIEQIFPPPRPKQDSLHEHGIMEMVYKYVYGEKTDNHPPLKDFSEKLIICMFCVFNVTDESGKPNAIPAVHYTDVNMLANLDKPDDTMTDNDHEHVLREKLKDFVNRFKASFFHEEKLITYKNGNKTEDIGEDYRDKCQAYQPLQLIRINNTNYNLKDLLISDDPGIIITYIKNDKHKYKIINDIKTFCESLNDASYIGTLELMDKVSKLYVTNTTCTSDITVNGIQATEDKSNTPIMALLNEDMRETKPPKPVVVKKIGNTDDVDNTLGYDAIDDETISYESDFDDENSVIRHGDFYDNDVKTLVPLGEKERKIGNVDENSTEYNVEAKTQFLKLMYDYYNVTKNTKDTSTLRGHDYKGSHDDPELYKEYNRDPKYKVNEDDDPRNKMVKILEGKHKSLIPKGYNGVLDYLKGISADVEGLKKFFEVDCEFNDVTKGLLCDYKKSTISPTMGSYDNLSNIFPSDKDNHKSLIIDNSYIESVKTSIVFNGLNYFLVGICIHAINPGHYVSYVKRGEKWYYVDDLNSPRRILVNIENTFELNNLPYYNSLYSKRRIDGMIYLKEGEETIDKPPVKVKWLNNMCYITAVHSILFGLKFMHDWYNEQQPDENKKVKLDDPPVVSSPNIPPSDEKNIIQNIKENPDRYKRLDEDRKKQLLESVKNNLDNSDKLEAYKMYKDLITNEKISKEEFVKDAKHVIHNSNNTKNNLMWNTLYKEYYNQKTNQHFKTDIDNRKKLLDIMTNSGKYNELDEGGKKSLLDFISYSIENKTNLEDIKKLYSTLIDEGVLSKDESQEQIVNMIQHSDQPGTYGSMDVLFTNKTNFYEIISKKMDELRANNKNANRRTTQRSKTPNVQPPPPNGPPPRSKGHPIAKQKTTVSQINNPQINNPQINNPQINNPQINNPQINNPQINNPQINKTQIDKTQTLDQNIRNVEMTIKDNPKHAFTDFIHDNIPKVVEEYINAQTKYKVNKNDRETIKEYYKYRYFCSAAMNIDKMKIVTVNQVNEAMKIKTALQNYANYLFSPDTRDNSSYEYHIPKKTTDTDITLTAVQKNIERLKFIQTYFKQTFTVSGDYGAINPKVKIERLYYAKRLNDIFMMPEFKRGVLVNETERKKTVKNLLEVNIGGPVQQYITEIYTKYYQHNIKETGETFFDMLYLPGRTEYLVPITDSNGEVTSYEDLATYFKNRAKPRQADN